MCDKKQKNRDVLMIMLGAMLTILARAIMENAFKIIDMIFK